MNVLNAHERRIARSLPQVFAELVALGTPADRIWPAPKMPFRRTPGEMVVGVTKERHGAIHAVLDMYQPNDRIVWRAQQPFLRGTHHFEVHDLGNNTALVRHVVDAKLPWWFGPVWTFYVGGIHDRILEGLFDRLERVPASAHTSR